MRSLFNILLCLIYYSFIVPLGLIIKSVGIDIMDMKFKNKKQTYWIKK